jgi:FkbM family methyltransferase
MTVFDIGANIGQTALPFSRWVGSQGKVVAIEPVPANIRLLRDNIELSGAVNVSVVEAALSDEPGVASFVLNPSQASMGKLENCEPSYNDVCQRGERIDVQTRRLDDLAAEFGAPDLLKVDVEGGARNVFAGGRKLLESKGPSIYLETHGPEERAAVRDVLQPLGYRLQSLAGEVVEDPMNQTFSPLWCFRPNGSSAHSTGNGR